MIHTNPIFHRINQDYYYIDMPQECGCRTVACIKGSQRYILHLDSEGKTDALRTMGRWASHPDLDFSWYDAAILSQRLRGSLYHVESDNKVVRIAGDEECEGAFYEEQ